MAKKMIFTEGKTKGVQDTKIKVIKYKNPKTKESYEETQIDGIDDEDTIEEINKI